VRKIISLFSSESGGESGGEPDTVRTKIVRMQTLPYLAIVRYMAFLRLRFRFDDNNVFRAIQIRLIVSLNARIKQQKPEH